jgi:hypothetical protein
MHAYMVEPLFNRHEVLSSIPSTAPFQNLLFMHLLFIKPRPKVFKLFFKSLRLHSVELHVQSRL